MPVQDQEDKRTADQPAADAEELRRQQAAKQKQQNETNIQKSGKLLPFLNAKAEHHQNRINALDEKIAYQTDKIDRNKAKIEALTARADKLEDQNRMLSAALGSIPLVRNFIESNARKIRDIRENKIPAREQKIEQGWKKIDTMTEKRDRIEHKLNRVMALNDAIRSFSIGRNAERREAFSNAMERLNEAAFDCLADKKRSLSDKKDAIINQYNDPATSVVDKFKLQQQINALTEKMQAVDARMDRVCQPDEFYTMQRKDVIDAQVTLTSDRIADMADAGVVSMPDLAENTLSAAKKTEELSNEQIAILADKAKPQPMKAAEEQLEDDYSMIDGIFNNGSKEDIDNARTELAEGIRSLQSLANNKYMPDYVREMAAQDVSKMQEKLAALGESEEHPSSAWLAEMLDNGCAEMREDGGYRVNADYYHELPREDRHFETMTESQAETVMTALTAAAVDFSAVSQNENRVSLVVSKQDVPVLNDIMYAAIGKIARTDAARENAGKGDPGRYETIHPEYYASLSDEQRFTSVAPMDTAIKITAALQQNHVPYSAVVRRNDRMAITVSKDNAQMFRSIERAVKGARAQEQAPPVKREGKGYFTRNDMRKEAQRVRQQGKHQDKSAPDKKKDGQGLG